MNLLNLYRLLIRRKLVVIPMLVLSVAGIYYAYSSAPPVYRSAGAVALANPAMPDTSEPGATVPKGSDNPYYRYGSLSVIVDILTRQVSSPAVVEEMQKKGLTGGFTAGGASANFTSGPIIDVTAEAASATEAKKSAQIVLDELKNQLQVLQDREHTARPFQIFTITVDNPQKATAVFSGTLRRLMMAVVAAGVLTIGSAVVADVFMSWRGKRRAAKRGDVAVSDAREVAAEPPLRRAELDAAESSAARAADEADEDRLAPSGDPALAFEDEVAATTTDGSAAPRREGAIDGARSTVRRTRPRSRQPAGRRVPRR